MDEEELGPIERRIAGLPRPYRWSVLALMAVLGLALLTLPIWRRLLS